MKRFASLLMALILLLSLTACVQDEEIVSPVLFYYLRSTFTYGESDSVIAAEVREASGCEEDYEVLIRRYLSGPQSGDFKSPFPASAKLVTLTWEDTVLCLTLSDSYAELTGLDLSLACTCLAKTAMELTGAAQVRIQAETLLLDGEESVMIDADSFILLDEEPTTATQADN